MRDFLQFSGAKHEILSIFQTFYKFFSSDFSFVCILNTFWPFYNSFHNFSSISLIFSLIFLFSSDHRTTFSLSLFSYYFSRENTFLNNNENRRRAKKNEEKSWKRSNSTFKIIVIELCGERQKERWKNSSSFQTLNLKTLPSRCCFVIKASKQKKRCFEHFYIELELFECSKTKKKVSFTFFSAFAKKNIIIIWKNLLRIEFTFYSSLSSSYTSSKEMKFLLYLSHNFYRKQG